MKSVPRHACARIFELVAAEEDGRRLPIPVADAALLREHGLVDYLGRSTERGRKVAEEYLDSLGGDT